MVKRSEYEALFYNQQSTMEAAAEYVLDVPDEAVFAVSDEDTEEEEEPVIAKTVKPVTYPKRARKTPVPPPMPDFITASFGIKSPIAPEPVKKEGKPTVDTSGVAVGVTLHHKAFGAGKVIELGGGLITVGFEQGQKRFEFPSAFDNGFLSV